MPRERDAPYVAAGFREDAQTLLERFVARKTLKFTEFAELWRGMAFSTVFMGRESLRELTEFIEESYRTTLLFMATSNPYQKAGAVYLLYSMYLKQPPLLLKSRVPILISYKQAVEFYNLENYFMDVESSEDVLDLSYIITKLFKMEAFNISCFPIPMGPIVPIPLLKLEPLRSSHFKEVLGNLNMLNESEIKGICELTKGYEELKKKLPCLCSTSKTGGVFNKYEELKVTIKELEDRYNAGLLPNKTAGDVKIQDEFRSLGQRRAMLKTQQYERAADVGMFRRVRPSSDSSPSRSPSPPVKRGPGRPRKKKPGRRGKKKKPVEVKIEPEPETQGDDDVQAEAVDNPDEGPRVTFFKARRPPKYPRPVRKHYFEENE